MTNTNRRNESIEGNTARTEKLSVGIFSEMEEFTQSSKTQKHQHDDPNFCAWGYPMSIGDY